MKYIKKVLSAMLALTVSFGLNSFMPETAKAEAVNWDAYLNNAPEWMPHDFDSAMDFCNTYGSTKAENDIICIVRHVPDSYKMEVNIKNYKDPEQWVATEFESNVFRFNFELPEEPDKSDAKAYADYLSLMDRYKYSGILDSGTVGYHYEALVLLNNCADDLDVNVRIKNDSSNKYLTDTMTYSFSDIGGNMTETDIYGWLPDSSAEYDDYVSRNGKVSVKDNYILFCLTSNAGTSLSWEEGSKNYSAAERRFTSGCNRENLVPVAGEQNKDIIVYQAVREGNADIIWDFVNSAVSGEIMETLEADCKVLDNGQTVLLNKDARITLVDYDSGEPIDITADSDITLYEMVNSVHKTVIGNIVSNPCVMRGATPKIDGGVGIDIPDGYEIPMIEGTALTAADYMSIGKYENGAYNVVFRLKKKSTEVKRVKINLIDSDTGELIPDEFLKYNPFTFCMTGSHMYIHKKYVVNNNQYIIDKDISSVYDKDKSDKYWNDQGAGQPDIKIHDDGSVDLTFTFRTNIDGDVNGDGIFSISDVLVMQKWLLGVHDSGIKRWKCGDLCKDGQLDTFDLLMMKKALIRKFKIPVSFSIHMSGGVAGVSDTWTVYEKDGKYFATYKDENSGNVPAVVEIPEKYYRELMISDFDKITNDDSRKLDEMIIDAFSFRSVITYADGEELNTRGDMSFVIRKIEKAVYDATEQSIKNVAVPVKVAVTEYSEDGETKGTVMTVYHNYTEWFVQYEANAAENPRRVLVHISKEDYYDYMMTDYESYFNTHKDSVNNHYKTEVIYSDGSVKEYTGVIPDQLDSLKKKNPLL